GSLASLHIELPQLGENVAIDSSDLPAYANGKRFLSKNGPERERYSDPDASWAIAPPSRLVRAAASTATSSTLRSAPKRSRGRLQAQADEVALSQRVFRPRRSVAVCLFPRERLDQGRRKPARSPSDEAMGRALPGPVRGGE